MSNDFEVRVISLANQAQRRNHMASLLSQSDLQWGFFDAIPGKEIAPYLKHYDRKKRLDFPGHDMTPNEIACFLSHREIWKQCVQKEKNFVILEDDAYVLNADYKIADVKKIISSITENQANDVLVRLGHGAYRNDYQHVAQLYKELQLVRYERDPLCALAYVISPRVAEKLLKHSETFYLPVDDFMWNGAESHVRVFDIAPALFFAAVEDNPSTIGDRKKKKVGFIKKVKREIFRAFYNFKLRKFEKEVLRDLKS